MIAPGASSISNAARAGPSAIEPRPRLQRRAQSEAKASARAGATAASNGERRGRHCGFIARPLGTGRAARPHPVSQPDALHRAPLRLSRRRDGVSMCDMRRPPGSLASQSYEGQFLIAMPSLREGPFARSVVYMCAHREDGAMGIVINQRADEIEFSELLVQLDIVGRGRSDSPAAAAPRRCGCCAAVRSTPGAASSCTFDRLRRRRFDRADRRGRLPDRDARHPAGDRQGRGPSQAVLALGCAGWASGQLESEILANALARRRRSIRS